MTIGYKGEQQDLLIRQGATFRPVLNLTVGGSPMDVTGLVFRSQIRKTFDSPIISASLSVTILDAVNGQIELYIADEVTEAITAGNTESEADSTYVLDNRYPFPKMKQDLKYKWDKIEVGGQWYSLS